MVRDREQPLRVLLLRSPRYVWPFNGETSAFWPPLGLLCLAAAVRRELPRVRVEVLDAPGMQMGWRSLARKLAAESIDVLGIGEETVSAHEALRAARIVKQYHPDCVVVAGGPYFAYALEPTFDDGAVDVVVRGEGERTFVELLDHIHDREAWPSIRGLAFPDQDGQIVVTPSRALIDDLDTLPFPAYDLVDIARYGRGARNHRGLVSIEHSRGCVDSCSFCILWKHMGESLNGNGEIRPRHRTKSPERSFEEVRRLYHAFGRRTFGWVDPTFNVSADWADGWAGRMLKSELVGPRGKAQTLHTGWLRADGVVRDEKLGILDKLVRAGLRQVMIGVERDDAEGLSALNKHHNDYDICREAFAIFREKYPEVYTIGTMIFGLPRDTRADLDRLIARRFELGMDFGFIMPLTPNPGTAAAEAARQGGYVASNDLVSYNFHTPVCTTDTLSLHDLESIYWRASFSLNRQRWLRFAEQLFLERDPRKRRIHWSLFRRGTSIAARSLLERIKNPGRTTPTLYWRKPSWYEQ